MRCRGWIADGRLLEVEKAYAGSPPEHGDATIITNTRFGIILECRSKPYHIASTAKYIPNGRRDSH